MPKKKVVTRAERIALEQARLKQTLKTVGVSGEYSRGVKAKRPDFPDLACSKPGLAPLSQAKGGNGFKRTKTIAVPDGYIIGNSHKQGLSIMPARELEWAGGKKSG